MRTPLGPGVHGTGLSWRGTLPARGYDVSLEVGAGRTTALVGPNGAGKSTTLDLLAGLLRPVHGRLAVGDTLLCDTASGIDVATHRRRIAVLGQDPLLFPHLTVRGNVEFALRCDGVPRRAARGRALELLAAVDADALAERRPDELSGGQAARVALARALAATPRAVLLDEPFAALDIDVAPIMRRVLADRLAALGVPALVVTHDLLDVLALADDLVVLENGRVADHGTVAEVLRTPRSDFAAGLAGVDRIPGRLTAPGEVQGDSGLVVRGVAAPELTVGARAVAVWAPTAVALFERRPKGSPRNVWPGVVRDLAHRGSVVRVDVEVTTPGAPVRIAADLSPGAVADLALRPGSDVWSAVKAQEVSLHPAR